MEKAKTASSSFYASIEPLPRFDDLTDARNYRPLPDDWSIAFADVVNSTAAIARGEYKAVNTVGVSVIAAVTNALKPVEVPYVFGGDGAVICVPSHAAAGVREAMATTAAMANERFGLDLRVALVPVSYLRSVGHDVFVGRHRVSPYVTQCALFGTGVAAMDRALKSGELPGEFLVRSDPAGQANYSGLECRWQEIPSPEEETVALIVEAAGGHSEGLAEYRRLLEQISLIYGEDDRYRPVREPGLRVTLSSSILKHEAHVRTWGEGLWERIRYSLLQRVLVAVGWWFFATGRKSAATDWGAYRKDLVANTDFRKLDGMLRLVISGNEDQRLSLEKYLQDRADHGFIRFGLHVSHSAIMTCLVSNRQHDHVHFVDASGGGYAEAARMMKGEAP